MKSFCSNDLYGKEIKTILSELDLKRFHTWIETQHLAKCRKEIYKQWMKEFIESEFQEYIHQLKNNNINYIPLCAFNTQFQCFLETQYNHFDDPLCIYDLLYLLKDYAFSIYSFIDYISSTKMFLRIDLPAL